MHIPDGFLSPPICAITATAATVSVGAALRRIQHDSNERLAPQLGMTAAYVFAAQMVNFTVAPGTSGHLLGSVLAAVILGPSAATIAMTAVFLVQTFFFVDGGYTALGANILNMGLAGTYGGYGIYSLLAGRNPNRKRCLASAAVAAWVAVMLGALLTSVELIASGKAPAAVLLPVMLGVHALIGIGEALLTTAALGLLWNVRPDLLSRGVSPQPRARLWSAVGLTAVAVASTVASAQPDGLEWAAERTGITLSTQAGGVLPTPLPAPMPDYALPGFENQRWAPAAVSLIGAGLLTGLLMVGLRGRQTAASAPRPDPKLDVRSRLAAAAGFVLVMVSLPNGDLHRVSLLSLLGAAACWWVRVDSGWLRTRLLLLAAPLLGLAVVALGRADPGDSSGILASAIVRAVGSFLATAALVGSSSEAELLWGFARLRCPSLLVQTLMFALRYIRVFGEETGRMLRARASRTTGSGGLLLRTGVAGGIIGSLFVRSFERSERVALVMSSRGLGAGSMPASGVASRLTVADVVFLGATAVALMGVWLWR